MPSLTTHHIASTDIWNRYGLAIKRVKKQHWDAFLEELSGKDLWTAQRFAANPAGDGGKARIPTLEVSDESRQVRSHH